MLGQHNANPFRSDDNSGAVVVVAAVLAALVAFVNVAQFQEAYTITPAIYIMYRVPWPEILHARQLKNRAKKRKIELLSAIKIDHDDRCLLDLLLIFWYIY